MVPRSKPAAVQPGPSRVQVGTVTEHSVTEVVFTVLNKTGNGASTERSKAQGKSWTVWAAQVEAATSSQSRVLHAAVKLSPDLAGTEIPQKAAVRKCAQQGAETLGALLQGGVPAEYLAVKGNIVASLRLFGGLVVFSLGKNAGTPAKGPGPTQEEVTQALKTALDRKRSIDECLKPPPQPKTLPPNRSMQPAPPSGRAHPSMPPSSAPPSTGNLTKDPLPPIGQTLGAQHPPPTTPPRKQQLLSMAVVDKAAQTWKKKTEAGRERRAQAQATQVRSEASSPATVVQGLKNAAARAKATIKNNNDIADRAAQQFQASTTRVNVTSRKEWDAAMRTHRFLCGCAMLYLAAERLASALFEQGGQLDGVRSAVTGVFTDKSVTVTVSGDDTELKVTSGQHGTLTVNMGLLQGLFDEKLGAKALRALTSAGAGTKMAAGIAAGKAATWASSATAKVKDWATRSPAPSAPGDPSTPKPGMGAKFKGAFEGLKTRLSPSKNGSADANNALPRPGMGEKLQGMGANVADKLGGLMSKLSPSKKGNALEDAKALAKHARDAKDAATLATGTAENTAHALATAKSTELAARQLRQATSDQRMDAARAQREAGRAATDAKNALQTLQQAAATSPLKGDADELRKLSKQARAARDTAKKAVQMNNAAQEATTREAAAQAAKEAAAAAESQRKAAERANKNAAKNADRAQANERATQAKLQSAAEKLLQPPQGLQRTTSAVGQSRSGLPRSPSAR